ncbi:MAG TPA: hypothetical protein PLV42_05735, partial [bacterium]|nr:hypothetical protein [bacterium]
PIGLTGPEGPQGPIGLTGPEGPQGPIGLTGATGPQGEIGPQGEVGPAGDNGHNTLAIVTDEDPGLNCENGGVMVQTGLDLDDNAVLEGAEIDPLPFYLCDGAPGIDGTNGADGATGLKGDKGDKGDAGTPGADGKNMLSVVDTLVGSACPASVTGQRIRFGLDDDNDTLLDPLEVDSMANVCNGVEGIPGLACWDIDEDGEMDPAEDINGDDAWDALDCIGAQGMTGPQGATGATGPQGPIGETGPRGPIGLTGATGPAGATGATGAKGTNGLACWDLNGDGTKDADEDINKDSVWDVLDCRGEAGTDGADGPAGPTGSDGKNVAVKTTDEEPGDNCPHGGKKIESGADDNDNGTLEAGEIDAKETYYICNGEAGTDGLSGHNALVAVDDQVGTNCDTFGQGGQRVRSGIDDGQGTASIADNGILEENEVDDTKYICNGTTAEQIQVTGGGGCSLTTL